MQTDYAWRTASASISIETFLPTITPPPSSTWLKVIPKASRSTSAVALNPARALPQGSVDAALEVHVAAAPAA